MSSTSSRGQAICWACKRPFNPSSPGATANMGPTCAKKAGHLAGVKGMDQFSFDEELHLSPRLEQQQKDKESRAKLRSSSFSTSSRVPQSLAEKYVLAKMAFDELMREFCREERVAYGEEALAIYEALQQKRIEMHSLHDPLLGWLEPEHDLHLIIDEESGEAYYWRIFNGTYTLLELEPEKSPRAKDHIMTIVAYSTAHKAYRKSEAHQQLSFCSDLFTL